MGVDIHAFIESGPPGPRECFAEAFIGRNTVLFGSLAGVRGGQAVYPPRGFPADASWDAWKAYCVGGEYASPGSWVPREDWFGASWLTHQELARTVAVYEGQNGRAGPWIYAVLAAMRELKDSRLVFWFDN